MTTPTSFRTLFPLLTAFLFSCGATISSPAMAQNISSSAEITTGSRLSVADAILAGAREEARKAVPYIMNYEVIKYPGGDVADGTGVCTDLVIRAFRRAGIDLQKEISTDRKARLSAYPDIWDKRAADRNIDHRRCPNLVAWLKKNAITLSTETTGEPLTDWKGGDIVFYVYKGSTHPWHVAIVSDKRDTDGMPLIIDSYPPHTTESHRLDDFAPIHSHFRMRAGGVR